MWLKPILLDSTEVEHPTNLIYMPSVALKVLSLFESKIGHNIVILKKKSKYRCNGRYPCNILKHSNFIKGKRKLAQW